jgi:tetratricopeptide (TPR) repeat protein
VTASLIRGAILSFFFFSLIGVTGCGTVPKIIVLNDPLSDEEHLRLGLSYEAQGQWDLALSEYASALKKGGSSSVIEGYRGNVYLSKKDYPSAKDAYLKSLSENPQNAPVLNNLAFLYLVQKEKLKEAEGLLRRAIEIDPSRKAYYLDTLGSLFLERDEPDLALSVYQEAEALAPSDPVFLEHLRDGKKKVIDRLERASDEGDRRRERNPGERLAGERLE